MGIQVAAYVNNAHLHPFRQPHIVVDQRAVDVPNALQLTDGEALVSQA